MATVQASSSWFPSGLVSTNSSKVFSAGFKASDFATETAYDGALETLETLEILDAASS